MHSPRERTRPRGPLVAAAVAALALGLAMPAASPASGTEPTWTAPAVMTSEPGAGVQLALSSDGSTTIAMWYGFGQVEGQQVVGVYAARRRADGTWSTPAFLHGEALFAEQARLVASASGQHALITFGGTEFSPDIWASSSSDYGVTWSTPVRVNVFSRPVGVSGMLSAATPVIASDGTWAAITWTNLNTDDTNAVVAVVSSNGGATWTQEETVRAGTDVIAVGSPTIGVTPSGKVVVSWMEEDGEPQRARARVRGSDGSWGAITDASGTHVGGLIEYSFILMSPTEDKVLLVYKRSAVGKDIWTRVGTLSGSTLTWGNAAPVTDSIEDLSYPEPALDIDDTATYEPGMPAFSTNGQRIVLPLLVTPKGSGSTSRVGVVASTDGGSTWGTPTWLTSGRPFVERMRSTGAGAGPTVSVYYTSEVYLPVPCGEEPVDNCSDSTEPVNGAKADEAGTWIATSTDGGATWQSAHQVSADLIKDPFLATSANGSVSAAAWTQGQTSMRWTTRGLQSVTTAPPSAPRSVTIVRGVKTMDVSWQAPSSAGSSAVTSYRATASPGGRTCTATPPTRKCTITQLTPGTAYTISVVARNGTHDGWGSAGISTQLKAAGTPGKVTGVTVTRPGKRRATVRWTAPGNTGGISLSGYRVSYRASGASKATVVSGIGASKTYVEISGLTIGRAYTFTVFAENDVASSAGETSKSFTAS